MATNVVLRFLGQYKKYGSVKTKITHNFYYGMNGKPGLRPVSFLYIPSKAKEIR